MGLFGRKKSREDDYDDPEDFEREFEQRKRDLRGNLKFKKKLKDLNPDNRRTRKTPQKPWGKKERLLVLAIFASSTLVAGFLAISSRGFKLPNFPSLNIKDLNFSSFNPFREQTITTRSRNGSNNNQKVDSMIASFKNTTKSLSGEYSFYYYNLSDNTSGGYLYDKQMQAASLIKLPVMYSFYQELEKGNVSLDEKYTLKNSDKIGGSGSLSSKQAGTVLTFRDLLRLMGKESDNTAFGIVRRKLGDELVQSYISEVGMQKTDLKQNTTSPKDIGIILQKIWEMSDKEKKELLGFLTDTIYEDVIPKDLPKSVQVAHKYGKEVNVVNDAGIILDKNPYILVLMSEKITDSEAFENLPKISRVVFDEHSR